MDTRRAYCHVVRLGCGWVANFGCDSRGLESHVHSPADESTLGVRRHREAWPWSLSPSHTWKMIFSLPTAYHSRLANLNLSIRKWYLLRKTQVPNAQNSGTIFTNRWRIYVSEVANLWY